MLSVIALSATAGTASASASTVLCKVEVAPCPAGSVWPKETTVSYFQRYRPGAFTLVGKKSLGELSCGEAVIGSQTLNEKGPYAKGAGQIGECTLNKASCTSTSWGATSNRLEALGSPGFVGWGSTSIGSSESPLTIGFKCFVSPGLNYQVDCTYAASGVVHMAMEAYSGEESQGYPYVAKFSNVELKYVKGDITFCEPSVSISFKGYLGYNTFIDYV